MDRRCGEVFILAKRLGENLKWKMMEVGSKRVRDPEFT
jgi:hypothetical protein